MSEPSREPEKAPSPHDSALGLSARGLFAARTVLIFGEVTTELAAATTAQLLALSALGREPIRVILHSPGGHVEAGDTIYDMIRFIEPEVKVLASGWVASAGALIYCAAEARNRYALPNTRFMLHQPLGGVGGPASDIEIEARQILVLRERLNRIFARATGQPYEKLVKDTDRNYWLTALEAREYGLVSRLVERASELDAAS
ncbi:MAG TPA: ATP-dependent Clp protease proteolytic subunit [Polyangiaceae bacterium]|nr:ATP-dependent Clp protease proteolytic subunit [Polyangiaceae bacterium]